MKTEAEERNLRGPNEGDLYATDAITYHIPDERLWMRSKIVFKFGQEGGDSSLVAAASFLLAVKQMCAAENENCDQKLFGRTTEVLFNSFGR